MPTQPRTPGPSRYVIVEVTDTGFAGIGQVDARNRDEANRAFADANPEAVANREISSFPLRQVELAKTAAIRVTVENKPVVTVTKASELASAATKEAAARA